MLKISPANAKLQKLGKVKGLGKWLKGGRKVFSLDLQAGASCPFADKCLSQAVDTNAGLRVKDGPNCLFRCYAASSEALYPATYRAHRHNFMAIKRARTVMNISRLILDSLPAKCGILRYHSSGDIFSPSYFRAIIAVAKARPDVLFYTYTKAIPFLVKFQGDIPPNLRVVASYGGKRDDLIPQYRGPSVRVVYSVDEASKLGLPIDHDDSHAAKGRQSFALLVHGIQPKGSKASKALYTLRKNNVQHSYSRGVK